MVRHRIPDMKEIQVSDVLELPVAERLKLVEAIWDSIAESAEAIPLTDEQRTELDRRLEEYEKDPEAGSPWPEVEARIIKLSVAEHDAEPDSSEEPVR
jgi:putative addiction module component (TIGR02574 family)